MLTTSTDTQTRLLKLHPNHRVADALITGQIGVDLAQINMTVTGIYCAYIGRARLDLSRDTSTFLATSPTTDAAALAASCGVAQSAIGMLSDVVTLLAATELSPSDLQSLLTLNLSDAELEKGVAAKFSINGRFGRTMLSCDEADPKTGTAASIAYLNPDGLDRPSRFGRLAAHLSWDYTQLDWILRITNDGSALEISGTTLTAQADMIDLAALAGLDIATLCKLLSPVKTSGASSDRAVRYVVQRPVCDRREPTIPTRTERAQPAVYARRLPWKTSSASADNLALTTHLGGADSISDIERIENGIIGGKSRDSAYSFFSRSS